MLVVPADALASQSKINLGRRWDKLSSPAEFDAVFRARCSSGGDLIRVLAKPNTFPYPRLGITVSKKICKTAVGRNYMKRVSRELFRKNIDALKGLDLVVLVKKSFGHPEYSQYTAEFQKHVQRVQKCRNSCVSSSAVTST
jgi:ribonuclease P protein component